MNGIRLGKISSVDYKAGMADVAFEDEEEATHQSFPFLSGEYQMPAVGDAVLVIFQGNSGGREQGYILGKPYGSGNMPEVSGKGVYFKRFSDTSFVRYDANTDTLTISAGKVVVENLEIAERQGD